MQVANEVGHWCSAVGVDERERTVVVVVDLALVVGASGQWRSPPVRRVECPACAKGERERESIKGGSVDGQVRKVGWAVDRQ